MAARGLVNGRGPHLGAGGIYFSETSLLSVIIELHNIRPVHLAFPEKMLAEIVRHAPEEIFVHVAESVLLSRKDEHVETFACPDECIGNAYGVGRMHIVIYVTVHQEEMPFQVLCYLRVGVYLIDEGGVTVLADLLLDAMVLLAPPAVVDAVVVVPGAGYRHLVEIRVGKYGCR